MQAIKSPTYGLQANRDVIEESGLPQFNEEQKLLLRDLFRAGTILTGDVVRARFGLNSPIYFNLRENLYSQLDLLGVTGQLLELRPPTHESWLRRAVGHSDSAP